MHGTLLPFRPISAIYQNQSLEYKAKSVTLLRYFGTRKDILSEAIDYSLEFVMKFTYLTKHSFLLVSLLTTP
jgi:hypothetical protein